MDVRTILAAKGAAVYATQPHHTLEEAASLLSGKGVGAVLVTDGADRLLGILSERDIVRALGRLGADALRDAVSLHMTKDVVSCSLDDRLADLMGLMTTGRFRHLPVHGRRPAGRRCLHRRRGEAFRLTEMEAETRALEHYISS